jgi:hypothetical protein
VLTLSLHPWLLLLLLVGVVLLLLVMLLVMLLLLLLRVMGLVCGSSVYCATNAAGAHWCMRWLRHGSCEHALELLCSLLLAPLLLLLQMPLVIIQKLLLLHFLLIGVF